MSPTTDPVEAFKQFVNDQKAKAAAANALAVANIQGAWQQQYAANVVSRQKRAPLAYPVYSPAPLQSVVDDNGDTHMVPFANLQPPAIPPEIPDAQSTGLAGNAGPDPFKVLNFALAGIAQQLADIKAALASLGGK